MTNPPPPPSDGGYPPPSEDGNPPHGGYQPPQGNYPPPPQGGYPPPPGSYPPPQQGGYGAPQGYPPSPGSYSPPPQGGYGAPQGYPPPPGSYPPPPQGGYGAPPPPGAYQPYGAPGFGGEQPFDIGTAFSWAWNKFSKNAAALIVPALVYGVGLSVVYGIIYGIAIALAPDSVSSYESYDYGASYSFASSFGATSIIVLILGYLVLFVLGGVVSSAYYGGLLDIANGQPVSIGSFFKPRNVGSVLIATLIVGIAVGIGYALCFLPGLVVALFTIFTTVLIVERNLSPIDAIKASIDIVKKNFVQVLLAYLVVAVITVVGALLCGIGLIVAVPVGALLLVYAYRRLSGGQVAPVTP